MKKNNIKDNVALLPYTGEFKVKLSESELNTISGAANLNEDDANSLTIVFETALNEKMKTYATEIQDHYESEAESQINEANGKMADSIGAYLDKAFNEWAIENTANIDKTVKLGMNDNMIEGILSLFKDSYVEIPNGRVDLVDKLAEEIKDLEKENASLEDSVAATELELKGSQCETYIKSLSEDLTDTQFEKFESLVEDLDIDNIATFKNKARVIRDNFFKSTRVDGDTTTDNSNDERIDESQPSGPTYANHAEFVLGQVRKNMKAKLA